jgi:hypothetical protein
MPVHGTFREMVDRHRHLPADGAGPPAPACERRRHSRRWTAAKGRGLGAPPGVTQGAEHSVGAVVLPGARHRGPLQGSQPRRRGYGVARHCLPGSPVHRAAPVLIRHAPIGATALTALVSAPSGSSCLGLVVLAGRVPERRQAGDRARGQLALSWCGQWRRAGGQIIRASRKRQRRKSPEGTIGERRRGRGRGFAPCRARSRAPAGRRQLRRRRGDQGHAIFPALPGSSGPMAASPPRSACGLGRAAVAAKGWVLAMLAAKAASARGSGPAPPDGSSPARLRQRRVRSAPRLSLRPPMPGQENRTRGGGRRHRASGPPGQRKK